jgi:hypothetical protein
MSEIRIRGFANGDEAAFFALNEEWIVRYFRMEEKDPRRWAIRGTDSVRGGEILIAESGGAAIGCCALVPMGSAHMNWPKWR